MRLKLQDKLIAIFLGIFVITFGLMGFITYQGSKEIVKQGVFKQLHCRIRGIRGRFESFCCERERDIKSKSTSMYIKERLREIKDGRNMDILTKEISMRLGQMIEDNPSAMELFILDTNGKVIASTDETQIGLDKSNRPYFLKGRDFVTGTTAIYHSPVFNKPTMLIFAPISQLKTGELLGVVVERVNFEYLSATVKRECALLEGEEIYALDGEGNIIFGSMAWRFIISDISNSDFIKKCLEGKSGNHMYKNCRGLPVVGKCSWLPVRECVLIVEISEKEAFKPIYRIRNWFFGVSIVAVMVIICLVIIISRRISLPIMRLKDAADKVASGDLKIRVDVDTKDEIEFLANSFNQMVNELRESRSKLRQWGEASEEEVKEKTKQLEEKIEELEKFNKLAVDRELKMISLKEEIENLKIKLKEVK